ncbi:MAG: methyltransferase [Actinobacteria bacterium]|nr:methyltransferase [Actinomycetota bacterium]
MSTPITAQAWTFADTWVEEGDVLRRARDRSEDLGVEPVSPAAAATLRLLAAAISAQAIVEVGTGAGVSGAALLAGMTHGGVLTSIDIEAEGQRAARETFTDLGHSPSRSRLIAGRALDVLPRMSDGAYDLVVVDGDRTEYPAIVTQATRLLRIGGLVVLCGMLGPTGMADPSQRDIDTTALRDAAAMIENDDDWVPALMTVGSGLLVALLARRSEGV